MNPLTRATIQQVLAPLRSPTRRNRLPGRNRLSELTAAGRPRPSYKPAQPSDRLIGLLMLRDEHDILPHTLATMTQWFDRIVALNGSSTPESLAQSQAILEATPEVAHVLFDHDLPIDHPTTDGCRQFLLDEARQRWGVGNWIGVLHADESWDQDPRLLTRLHNPKLDPVIRVRLIHAFLHHDQPTPAPCEETQGDPRQQIGHYMWPGVPESRLFFDAGDRDYEIARHTKVVPLSLRTGPLHNGYWIAGYNERSAEQLTKRAADRIGSGWQRTHYANVPEEEASKAEAPTVGAHSSVTVASLHERSPTGTFDAAHHDPHYGRARPLSDDSLPLRRRGTPATPIFLGGVGRTGSRLTKELLGQSPTIAPLPLEMKFLTWPAGALDLAHQPQPHLRRLARWWKRMHNFEPSPLPDELGGPTNNWGFRANLGQSQPEVGYTEAVAYTTRLLASRRLTLADRQVTVRELTHWLLDRSLTSSQTHWIDQTPATTAVPHQLLDTFPTGRLYNVIRDPRDVTASLARAWWGPDDPTEAAKVIAAAWRAWEFFTKTSPHAERSGLLRFEELVANPAAVCGDVWNDLGLPAPPKPALVPPPAKAPASRADLSSSQLAAIERTLRPVLAAQGY